MRVTVGVEVIPDVRVVIEYLELGEALDGIPNVVLVPKCLLVVGQVFVDTNITVVLVRSTEFEQFSRYVPCSQHIKDRVCHRSNSPSMEPRSTTTTRTNNTNIFIKDSTINMMELNSHCLQPVTTTTVK